MSGRKTIELRDWTTDHRGPLLIHAGKILTPALCRKHGLDPEGLPRGALVGAVEVVDLVDFQLGGWDELRDQHLDPSAHPRHRFGWRLRNPRRLVRAIPCLGQMRLFQPPAEVLTRVR